MNERLAISRIGGVVIDRAISDTESRLRLELAAVFRVSHHLGWNYDTLNHITVRIPGENALLMNPAGLGWDEMTASSPPRPTPAAARIFSAASFYLR